MERKNLTQYVFTDGSESIIGEEGKLIALKSREGHYFSWKGNFAPKVCGSQRDLFSLVGLSNTPKVGEHLLTFRGVLIFGRQYISNRKIREINKDFKFEEKSNYQKC